ncbi:MAG: phage tail sheath family protein [Ilumatobacteraceae bacterium]
MPSYLTPGVYVEEVPSGQATLSAGLTAVAAFVGFTADHPKDDASDPQGLKPRLVTSWTQYESLYGGFVPGAMLPHSVYGFFNNGGGMAYIVRVAHQTPSDDPGQLALPAVDRALGQPIEIQSIGAADGIAVVVEPGSSTDEGEAPKFNLVVTVGGKESERFDDVSLADVSAKVNGTSTKIKVETKIDLGSLTDPAIAGIKTGAYAIAPAPAVPVEVKPKHFAGSESERTGINGLVIADEVTMVMVPDLITAATKADGSIDLGMWKAVQTALITHCEGQANRMAILDSPPGMSPQQVKEWRSDVAMYDSAFAAFYYPWIRVDNPASTGPGDATILVPPSGHVAGIWSRVDDTRGVWKAPANEVVRGVLSTEIDITKGEQSLLNPIGINCIRPFGTRGIRVWGARTLSSNTDWTYINVRRLFNMIETAIMEGTQFAVFEPNDQKLWEGLKRTISAFLRGLWRDGALFGATAEQAYFVKCDAETNPPDSIDQGKVVVEVGIAPVKPAEFVIFRISQLRQAA